MSRITGRWIRLDEAARIFRTEYADFIRKNKKDKPMLNLAWTTFLDGLNRDGHITDKQFSNAGNLFRMTMR